MAAPQPSLLAAPRGRDPATIAELRGLIRALERGSISAGAGVLKPASLGLAGLDRALPAGGLSLGALHEVVCASPAGADAGAGSGFAVALVARLLAAGVAGPVLWCLSAAARRELGEPYAPGLAGFGLDPGRLLFARARRDADVLWAMHEGLGCTQLAAVIGETETAPDLAASRRLQLAAGASGVTAFLVSRRAAGTLPSAALTRWRIAAAPSEAPIAAEGPRAPRWRVVLERCRGGVPGEWLLEWRHETGGFALAAALPDRSAEPASARLAG
jgi:protein ImuA